MSRCEYTDICKFFADEVGYSIDLYAHMRMTYCLSDPHKCARRLAKAALAAGRIPDDLLPTDMERALELAEKGRDRTEPA